jgi:hypothetical protein
MAFKGCKDIKDYCVTPIVTPLLIPYVISTVRGTIVPSPKLSK